jgi:TolB-like protein
MRRILRVLGSVLVIVSSCALVSADDQFKGVPALLSAKIKAANKKRVAVVDFTDLHMNVTELGRYLAEEMQGALQNEASAAGFVVVDRTHLKSILQEHKLAASGVIDPQTARRLGEFAGVDCLITGSLTPLGDTVRMSVKALDVTTAQVIDMRAVDIPKTGAIASLLAAGISGDTSADPAPIAPTEPHGGGGSRSKPSTTVNSIKFEVQSCRRNGTEVQCDLLLTSLKEDVKISVGVNRNNPDPTRIFDNSGAVHVVQSGSIGGQPAGTFEIVGTLIINLPTPLTLTFADTKAPTLPAMYIWFWTNTPAAGNSNWLQAVIRDVHMAG